MNVPGNITEAGSSAVSAHPTSSPMHVLLILCFLVGPMHADLQIISGNYTGDGTDDRSITGLGFQPDMVIVKGSFIRGAVCRTSTMTGDATKPMYGETALLGDVIQSLDTDGFTVGTDNDVNKKNTSYYWVAFKAEAGELYAGAYTGDGTDDRSITDPGFQPAYVIVLADSASDPLQRSSAMAGDASIGFGLSGFITDGIQALEANGFQVGTSAAVNEDGTAYHYIAWKGIAGQVTVGSYTGNGVDDRNITDPGLEPQYVIVKAGALNGAVHRASSITGDSTLSYVAAANFSNAIQAFLSNGFQVGTSNTVNKDGTDYYWVAFGLVTPTAVRLRNSQAFHCTEGVLIRWKTGLELENLGFNVYRETDGTVDRLNPGLIAGSALVAGPATPLTAGRSYRWYDRIPPETSAAQYWLEDVDLNGQRTVHGPVVPQAAGPSLENDVQTMLLSRIGRTPSRQEKAAATHPLAGKQPVAARSVHGRAAMAPGTENVGATVNAPPWARPGMSAHETQLALAAGAAIKIPVKDDGWYRMTQPDLIGAGLDPEIDPRRLQLFLKGREQPILVQGEKDGRFDEEDAVEFYGVGLDSAWSDTQTYWLAAGTARAKRVLPARKPAGCRRRRIGPSSASFPFTVECKERQTYFAALKNGEAENFFGAVIASEPVEQTLTVRHIHPDTAAGARVVVELQGVTKGSHHVAIELNGQEVGTISFSGQSRGLGTFPISSTILLDGSNVVRLVPEGGETDVCLVDVIRITYQRTLVVENNAIRFTAHGRQRITLHDVLSPQISVMDITSPEAVVQLPRAVRPCGESAYTCAVTVWRPGIRTILAFTPNGTKHPAAIIENRPSLWHRAEQGADVVIITHRDFFQRAQDLKAFREDQGWSVALIDVEDLYDEFSFGTKDPAAIRGFLARTQECWNPQPHYLMLLGDASVDPRGYLGTGHYDFVPTKPVETNLLETASDDWFADTDDDGVPELAVGRLPVRSPQEAGAIIDKIISHDPSTGGRSVLLVAGEITTGCDFEAASGDLESLIPEDTEVRQLLAGPNPSAHDELLESLNSGPLLVNYMGHGSVGVWGSGLFDVEDARHLTNGSSLSFFVTMTCLNGYFHDVYSECLGEALLRAEDGGALAVWASSGLTGLPGQASMNRELMRLLFNGEPLTVGEATRRAKAAVRNRDVRRTWVLLGDPLTSLR